MPNITINAKDFLIGESVTEFSPNGGYSPTSDSINLLAEVGLLKPGPAYTDLSGTITGNILAMNQDDTATLAEELIMVGEGTGAAGATFYRWENSAAAPVLKQSDTGTARTYSSKYTDIQRFNGNVFASSRYDIAKIDAAAMSSIDPDWWSTTATGLLQSSNHRFLVYDKKLFVTDQYKLHYWDGSAITLDVLDLSGVELNEITDIAVNESTGDMLIAAQPNVTQGIRQNSKIYIWDGTSTIPNRVIHTNGFISSFFTHGGTTYVFYDDMFGYFNGSGITALKKLDIEQTHDDYVYKQKVTSVGDTIYITETDKILAFGPLYPGGSNVFYHVYNQNNNTAGATGNITAIRAYANNSIAVGSKVKKFGKFTSDASDAPDSTFVSNTYYLPENSLITKVDVLLEGAMVSGDNINFKVYYSDAPDTSVSLGGFTYSIDGAISQRTFQHLDKKSASIKIEAEWAAGETGIRQIKIYYEKVEENL